ncbi:lysozyme inhibitor LprI family protein [Sphingomonas canadensis]|uniref:Lysozyme inhibitor LprI family protein n=1 Tax=Sphingomonas canadensis TaxID=1219257 RepID=A0ABW3H5J5_9SPHN|nr:hypothetical protein [Sphingomonas canadensis]MCW3836489.1 hypothetical protein [Sphingomonas canadensis]
MVRTVLTSLTLAAAACFALPASAASFDCAKASAPDEKVICKTLSLNDKDVKMAVLFGLVKSVLPMGGRGEEQDMQMAWLKERRACGANAACIGKAYDRRIAHLQSVIDERVISNGPF